jgi:hypothetical protein
VTITGAYFNDIYSVSFGGMPTTAFQVTKNDNITVTVPADAITGAIVVENPAGIGTSLYYQPAPFIVTPVITTIDPITGPAGTIVTITGSGFFDTTAVAVGGETPGAAGSSTFTYHSQNEVVVVVGANATTGPVVLTASGVASAPGPAFTVTPP